VDAGPYQADAEVAFGHGENGTPRSAHHSYKASLYGAKKASSVWLTLGEGLAFVLIVFLLYCTNLRCGTLPTCSPTKVKMRAIS